MRKHYICYRISLLKGSRKVAHRQLHTEPPWRALPILANPSVDEIRQKAFLVSRPVQFTLDDLESSLPAAARWFAPTQAGAASTSAATTTTGLNDEYLSPHGSTLVPLELTSGGGAMFKRAEAPLSLFIEYCRMALVAGSEDSPPTSRFYLAQAPISRLPQPLRDDLPIPHIVQHAGAGDVYDANVWMGLAPTSTPLHRDPNPNFFVQLAGTKVVRLVSPDQGDVIFDRVQTQLRQSGSKTFRGTEMMVGRERELLEGEVWGYGDEESMAEGYEVALDAGSGVFIPQGWWHSIRGVGFGVTASVNWWFR